MRASGPAGGALLLLAALLGGARAETRPEAELRDPSDSHEPQRAVVRFAEPVPAGESPGFVCSFLGPDGALLERVRGTVAADGLRGEAIYYGWPRARAVRCARAGTP